MLLFLLEVFGSVNVDSSPLTAWRRALRRHFTQLWSLAVSLELCSDHTLEESHSGAHAPFVIIQSGFQPAVFRVFLVFWVMRE